MPVKYVELGLLCAPHSRSRTLFQELFQKAKGRGIERSQCSARKSNASFRAGNKFADVENCANSADSVPATGTINTS